MADRRPLAIVAIAFVTAAVMLVGAIFVSQNGSGVSRGSRTRGHGSDRTNVSGKGSINESKYPKGIVLLPAANDGTASGIVICGNCSFKTVEACNVMLWDTGANHLVTVLQNDKYDELDKLIGSTWTWWVTPPATVVATGVVTVHNNKNYILVQSFETISKD